MDLLRWILLGLGLLLIAAVWWHGRRNRPAHEESLFESARRRWRERTTEATVDEGRDPAELDLPERDDPDFGFDPAELDDLFDRGRESTEAPVARHQPVQGGATNAGTRRTAGGDSATPTDPDGTATPAPPTPRTNPDNTPASETEGPFAESAAGDGPRARPEPDEVSPQGENGVPDESTGARDDRAPEHTAARHDTTDNKVSRRRRGGEHESADAGGEAEERIVVLYVVAPPGERLDGANLHEAFTALGLEHGELEIFHGRDEAGRKLFSVANATEPGTFDPATMADLQTPGVALFARLPGPQSPTRTFDAMAGTARRLAEMLGARALDERQSTLTRQTEQAMRDELLEYEHRRARHQR